MPTVIVAREATIDDARFLFDLANDPVTRAMSFTTDPIPWETHVSWLEGVLADPERRLWVVETWDGQPMGMERLDVREGYEVVSLALAWDHRGQGHAKHMVNGLCRNAKLPLLAEIKPENAASIRAFEECGFVPDGHGRWVKDPPWPYAA